MNLLPFGKLPGYAARRFVPEDLDLGCWRAVAPLFQRLREQAEQANTGAALERWLQDWGELLAALDQESTQRYVAMTCHTDNPTAERDYLHFVETLEPEIKRCQFELERLYLAHPARAQLPAARYGIFERNTRARVELFRQENVPLETEESKLAQQYQKICGGLTVQFRGEEKTLAQMARYLEEPDRAVRQEAWTLVANRRLQVSDQLDDLFDQMLELRERIARNAGFDDFVSYAFRLRGRFDYTPADCLRFHEAIEQAVLPRLRRIQEDRRRTLQLESLRPWDLAVDPLNRAPLRPFTDVAQMVSGAQRIFERLDPALAAQFRQMQALGLLDLDNRKGKAPGGYQSTLAEARLPFIFMNAVGLQRDVETLLHEAGHAFHAFASRTEDFFPYREAPIEFCEVASMSMELLGNQFLDVFHEPADVRRAQRDHLEGILEIFPWIATVDSFQHWLYTHPGHSRGERQQAWSRLMQRFGGAVDWSGLEAFRDHLWHRQLHIFIHPFYYVEYGIAQLGALQIRANARRDPAAALRDYRNALALGGSLALPQLFAAAGCRLDFGAPTLRSLLQPLGQELGIQAHAAPDGVQESPVEAK